MIAALEAGWTLRALYVEERAQLIPAIDFALSHARAAGYRPTLLSDGTVSKVADAVTPQPVVAIVEAKRFEIEQFVPRPLILVVDRVQDPGNLGALARVAEACGASGLVLTGSCADPFGPKALRASAGSALRLPIVEHEDAFGALHLLEEMGYATAATTPHVATDFAFVDWPAHVALVLGNEAQGLDTSLLSAVTLRVGIPMAEGPESLNLAVAAGIISMAIVRRLAPRVGTPGAPNIGAVSDEELS